MGLNWSELKGRKALLIVVSLMAMLVVIYGVYQPGLSGDFVLDDRNSIELNQAIKIEALSSDTILQAWDAGKTGGLGRPLAMLSFGLTHYLYGPSAEGFKLSNVVIHMVNALLVIALLKLLLTRWSYSGRLSLSPLQLWTVAILAGVFWAVHPLHISSVLYAVQRMTLLSALFTLTGLCLYMLWRQYLNKAGFIKWLLPPMILLSAVLGVLSKENAVLLFPFLLLIECLAFGGPRQSQLDIDYRRIFFSLAALGFIAVLIFLQVYEGWYISEYTMRDFTLKERLLTEARVIFHYILWVLYPTIENYGLFHDDIVTSTGWLTPLTTVLSIAGLVVLLIAAWYSRLKAPWLAFGVGFFLLGHSLESTIIPLELVFEHRNYLPSLGLVLIAAMAFLALISALLIRRRVYVSVISVLLIFVAAMTSIRSLEWSSYYTQMLATAERHPDSARAQWSMGIWYLQAHSEELNHGLNDKQLYDKAYEYAIRAANNDENYASSYFGLVLFNYRYNREVPELWLTELQHRLLHSSYRVETDDYFEKLIQCFNSDDCHAPYGDVRLLFNAVLNNPTLNSSAKANFLSGLATVEYKHGQLAESSKTLEQAMQLKPGINGYTNLVVIALEMGDKTAAENNLMRLKLMSGEKSNTEIEKLEQYVLECCDKPVVFE